MAGYNENALDADWRQDVQPALALAVLLHEMVHLRKHAAGLPDCHTGNQYHSRNFRDLAVLCGLACGERDGRRGYGFTSLDRRGGAAVQALRPNRRVFRWVSAPE